MYYILEISPDPRTGVITASFLRQTVDKTWTNSDQNITPSPHRTILEGFLLSPPNHVITESHPSTLTK